MPGNEAVRTFRFMTVGVFTNNQNELEIAKAIIDEATGRDSLAFAWLK
jgi:hypothetical protein